MPLTRRVPLLGPRPLPRRLWFRSDSYAFRFEDELLPSVAFCLAREQADMIREAIQRKASFNIVHLGTMFKADVFIMKGDSWSREEMSRVREETIESLGMSIRFASPELAQVDLVQTR